MVNIDKINRDYYPKRYDGLPLETRTFYREMVRTLAKKFAGDGITVQELVDLGYAGLNIAEKTHESNPNVPLDVYARWCAGHEMVKHILKKTSPRVIPPIPTKTLDTKCDDVRIELSHNFTVLNQTNPGLFIRN